MKNRMQSFVNRGNNLIQKGKTEAAMKLMANGFDYYSRRVIKALYPYSVSDAGMLVIVLRHLADQIEKRIKEQKSLQKGCRRFWSFQSWMKLKKWRKQIDTKAK